VPLIAHLYNGDKVHSTHTCTLDLSNLPAGARAAHIIPGLASHSLLSVVTMCNAGCTVTFTKISCTIAYRGRTIVCGHKCTRTGLWMVPLSKSKSQATSPSDSNIIPPATMPTTTMAANVDATSSTAKYARYTHQLLCSPPTSTLLRALEQSTELTTTPSLTSTLIHSHLPHSTATDKGHMRQHRANTASTRNMQANIIAACAEVDRMFLAHEACTMQDVFFFAALADANAGTMYSNLTGAFPVRSFKNMQYVFVAFVYDLNAIIVHAMPT
jgi:hypothetical protein